MKNLTIKFDAPSLVASIEHDGETLRVYYRSGSAFDYEDVSDELVTGLAQADDKARFIVHRIRPDREPVRVSRGTPFPRLAWD